MKLVVNSPDAKGIAVSFIGRIIAGWRWVCAGEQLAGTSAAPPPPRTSLRFFLFSRDTLGTAAPEAKRAAQAGERVPLYRYVAIGETLPACDDADRPRSLARPERSNFWRWFFTPETLPPADADPRGGSRSHPKES